jgi:hypothetical protein
MSDQIFTSGSIMFEKWFAKTIKLKKTVSENYLHIAVIA